jgi:3-deoxy-D-manno-octulosonic-acid transferase
LDDDLRRAAAELRREWRADLRPLLVAASTHPGEETLILDALQRLLPDFPNLLLVLVPRHPERFDSVAQLCAGRGLGMLRRSAGGAPGPEHPVLLGDTMGELLLLLSNARLALIGGSLVPHGGHNMLEAAAWGVPVITGPHVFNFAEISDLMVAAGAMERLQETDQLTAELARLLGDEQRLAGMGQAGLEVVQTNRGARHRLLELIDEQLAPIGTGRE